MSVAKSRQIMRKEANEEEAFVSRPEGKERYQIEAEKTFRLVMKTLLSESPSNPIPE